MIRTRQLSSFGTALAMPCAGRAFQSNRRERASRHSCFWNTELQPGAIFIHLGLLYNAAIPSIVNIRAPDAKDAPAWRTVI